MFPAGRRLSPQDMVVSRTYYEERTRIIVTIARTRLQLDEMDSCSSMRLWTDTDRWTAKFYGGASGLVDLRELLDNTQNVYLLANIYHRILSGMASCLFERSNSIKKRRFYNKNKLHCAFLSFILT